MAAEPSATFGGADAALVAAVADDDEAPFDLDGLATEVGATRTLLEAVARAGILLPHHIDIDGVARYSAADAAAVRAGMTLLDAGLPLGELLALGRRTDQAIDAVAAHAVDAFLTFVRDQVHGTSDADDEAADRLVTAYEQMLPATQQLVAHQLRRRILTLASERILNETDDGSGEEFPGEPDSDAPERRQDRPSEGTAQP